LRKRGNNIKKDPESDAFRAVCVSGRSALSS
jgi:hypothetical protein